MAVANSGSNNVSIVLTGVNRQLAFAVLKDPTSVAVGDFNGDGKLDLAVTNRSSNCVSILLGNGDGTFQTQVPYPTQTSPDSVAIGDFNGDGKLDLAVANGGSMTVSILLGNGDGTFRPKGSFKATYTQPVFVAVADFNGDGKLDYWATATARFNRK